MKQGISVSGGQCFRGSVEEQVILFLRFVAVVNGDGVVGWEAGVAGIDEVAAEHGADDLVAAVWIDRDCAEVRREGSEDLALDDADEARVVVGDVLPAEGADEKELVMGSRDAAVGVVAR